MYIIDSVYQVSSSTSSATSTSSPTRPSRCKRSVKVGEKLLTAKGHQRDDGKRLSATVGWSEKRFFCWWMAFAFYFLTHFLLQTIFWPRGSCVLSSVLTLGPNIGVHQPLQPLHNIPMRSLVRQQYLNWEQSIIYITGCCQVFCFSRIHKFGWML